MALLLSRMSSKSRARKDSFKYPRNFWPEDQSRRAPGPIRVLQKQIEQLTGQIVREPNVKRADQMRAEVGRLEKAIRRLRNRLIKPDTQETDDLACGPEESSDDE